MSYRRDPVHATVRWLRARERGPGSFTAAVAERWAAWARIEPAQLQVRVGLVDYEPFERARVMVDVTLRPGRAARRPVTLNLYLHACADAEAAGRELDRARGLELRQGFGPPLLHFPERHLVGWTLPNAPELEDLAQLLEPIRFRGLLGRVAGLPRGDQPPTLPRLVRYVPLERALLVWHEPVGGQRYWLKLINPKEAAATALGWREIAARYEHGAFTATVPRLVHYWPDVHTMLISEVPGRPLTELLGGAQAGPMAEVGRALAELHGLRTRPGRDWSFAGEHAHARRRMAGVSRAVPALAPRISRLLDWLQARMPEGEAGFAPIHGNLACDRILYEPAAPLGQRVGIVDWSTWCHGDRHCDLARLIAHLVHLARLGALAHDRAAAAAEALVDAYRSSAGRGAVDRAQLAWQVATALLLRARAASLARLVPGWPRHVGLLLAEAERIAGGNQILARPAAPAGRPSPHLPEPTDEHRSHL